MYSNYDAEETEATAAEKDAKFNKFVEQSKLDKVTKQNLKNSAKIATKNPSRFRTAVSNGKFFFKNQTLFSDCQFKKFEIKEISPL